LDEKVLPGRESAQPFKRFFESYGGCGGFGAGGAVVLQTDSVAAPTAFGCITAPRVLNQHLPH
jgi:hypothetical protein